MSGCSGVVGDVVLRVSGGLCCEVEGGKGGGGYRWCGWRFAEWDRMNVGVFPYGWMDS